MATFHNFLCYNCYEMEMFKINLDLCGGLNMDEWIGGQQTGKNQQAIFKDNNW